jgi:inner membrane protein
MHGYAQAGGSTDRESATTVQARHWQESVQVWCAHQSILLLTFVATAVIMLIDDAFFSSALELRLTELLDEIAHAATMVVVLCALSGRVSRAFAVGGLFGAVMLDIDHLSILFHLHAWAPLHGRPYSHSLVAVVAVMLFTCLSRSWRTFGIGVACGLLSHLFRDLATGVVPLLWPLTTVQFSIPHSLYEAAIVGALAWTVVYKQGAIG